MRSVPRGARLGILAALALLLAAAPALAGAGSRLAIDGVTAFAPRGEVYVEVQAACRSEDFPGEEPLLAYVELMVGERPPVNHDLRVEASAPRVRQTLVFEGRDFASGDQILVRLMRSGQVLALRSLIAP